MGVEPAIPSEDNAVRTFRVFSWSTVETKLLRTLLVAAYQDSGRADDVAMLKRLDSKGLSRQAERALGRPPKPALMERPEVADVLLSRWLPSLPVAELERVVGSIQLSLSGPDRSRIVKTKPHLLAFIRMRNNTATLRRTLRQAFIRNHKVARPVTGTTSGGRVQRTVAKLVGSGAEAAVEPYPHQRVAWKQLDALVARKGRNRAGLLVLPTGSGKTFTVVHWLLGRMNKEPRLRVLWLADQQELIEQAAREFDRHAAAMPATFLRRLRVIHSAASPVSALADPMLGVACMTRQSLIGGASRVPLRHRMEAFLSRPTIVVVDEAHHAVGRTYQELLSLVQEVAPRSVLLGLTATPWPSGQGMTKMLRERFPVEVISVEPLQLIKDGLLARPVVHSIATGQHVLLDQAELSQLARTDVPPSVLQRLDLDNRNQLIVSTWREGAERWGKTLVFAGTIAHAEHLGQRFAEAGVRCLVLHSQSEVDRINVLREFRAASSPLVLVSVGMLLEGVDIPDARTAVLARPTTSRVLMRQMIGRVLRGPRAGGDTEAHIIAIEDHWVDGIDIISPIDVGDVERPAIEVSTRDSRHRLPAVLDELTQEPVAENLLRRIQRAYAELLGHPTVSITAATLDGYFVLHDVNIPVFRHARERWDKLIDGQLRRAALPTRSALDLFGDLAVPRPTRQDVDSVVDFVSSTGLAPQLVELKLTFSMRELAKQMLDSPAMTERDKIAWQQEKFEATLARSVYASFQSFSEAINQEVLVQSGQVPKVANPESPDVRTTASGLPKIRRSPGRRIEPLLTAAATEGRRLLTAAGEHGNVRMLEDLPAVSWTRFPVQSTYAVWVPRISGKSKGTPVIRVNLALQAPTSQVPDNLLKYLLWHELCHHILPGHSHDAEFHRLLVMWPGFVGLDFQLDSLTERFDLGWKRSMLR